MLTGTTSWTIGSTKAPPFITTFCPPRPVRTNARSFDDRRYSQFISQTTMATTAASTISARITAPNCAPVMGALLNAGSFTPDSLELPGRLGQRYLGGQALHARGTVEAVTLPTALQDVPRVGRPRDRPAVAENDHFPVHRARRRRPGVDQRHALVQRDRRLCADGAAGGEPEVTNDDVRARLGHVDGVLLREHVG